VIAEFAVSCVEPVDGVRVIVVCGEVDLFGAPRLRAELLRAIESEASQVVVDLSETRFIDSTTLGVLLEASKLLRAKDGDLVLVIDNAAIRKIFEITLLERAFRIYETRDDALADGEGRRDRPSGRVSHPPLASRRSLSAG
jgi:anti-sigma B factor antagonist